MWTGEKYMFKKYGVNLVGLAFDNEVEGLEMLATVSAAAPPHCPAAHPTAPRFIPRAACHVAPAAGARGGGRTHHGCTVPEVRGALAGWRTSRERVDAPVAAPIHEAGSLTDTGWTTAMT